MSCFNWDDDSGTTKRTKMSPDHALIQAQSELGGTVGAANSWDIDGGLAADFDGSLQGLGSELGAATYNMSEALMALPVFKQEMEFQYILCAATSPAVKINEETLTYLNQGQSYEIQLKRIGDIDTQEKYLHSVVKVLFHGRREQYMEREMLENWKLTRLGERLLDIDIPGSYGIWDVRHDLEKVNTAEFFWDPSKDAGVHGKVNCISTEFTAKKHGGEKGVPFRIQVETYSHGDGKPKLINCASCQVKVFKPKGADRKNKTDRDKLEKRSESDKGKYQPSYECTVLADVPICQAPTSPVPVTSYANGDPGTPGTYTSSVSHSSSKFSLNAASPISAESSISSSPALRLQDCVDVLSLVSSSTIKDSPTSPSSHVQPLQVTSTASEVAQWLTVNRFSNYIRIFQHFSGADLFRLSRDDLIQICGVADGIRLNNALQLKSCRPKKTIYVCHESGAVYNAVYLENTSVVELLLKISQLYQVQEHAVTELYFQGPSQIHILVTDDVIENMQDHSRFCLVAVKDESTESYRIVLKTVDC